MCTRHETTELPTACQGQEHYDACLGLGNDETFRHLQARLGQATHEVRNIIKESTGVAPITLDDALPLKSADGQAGDKSDDSSADGIPLSGLLIPNPPVR